MTKRIEQVNDLLQEELGKIILKEIDFPLDVLVTLTRADASPNLQQAKIYVSAIPEKRIEEIIEILDNKIYDIQQQLNKKLNMRPVPRIEFVIDKSSAEAGEVEEILEKIKEE